MPFQAASINVTTMVTALAVILEREDDIIFPQEHATKAGKARAVRAVAAERGWRMDLDPVDETTETTSAGVGAMWNPGTMKVHVAALHTECQSV